MIDDETNSKVSGPAPLPASLNSPRLSGFARPTMPASSVRATGPAIGSVRSTSFQPSANRGPVGSASTPAAVAGGAPIPQVVRPRGTLNAPPPRSAMTSNLNPAARTTTQQNQTNAIEQDGKVVWPDLSMYGLFLGTIRVPSGQQRLVLVDEAGKWQGVAENQGFVATKWEGVFVREAIRLNLADLKLVFPHLKSVRLSPDDVSRAISKKMVDRRNPSLQPLSAASDAAPAAPSPAAAVSASQSEPSAAPTVGEPQAEAQSLSDTSEPVVVAEKAEAAEAAEVAAVDDVVSSVPLGAALRQSVYLGVNHLGYDVFDGLDGRFLRRTGDSSDEQITLTEAETTPAVYLRAPTDADMVLCAKGLVQEIQSGRILRSDDITRFLCATFPTDQPNRDSASAFQQVGETERQAHISKVNRAVDRALVDALAEGASLPTKEEILQGSVVDDAAQEGQVTPTSSREARASERVQTAQYALALSLHEGQPGRFQRPGEFLTPLPIAVVMQRMLSIPASATATPTRVIESLTGEHTALISEQVKRVDQGYSHFIGGWYGEPLAEPVQLDGVQFRLSDQAAIASMLAGRDKGGRAVIALAVDRPGTLDPAFRRFADWLFSRYKVDGLFDIDPNLVGAGATKGTRLVVVGARHAEPAIVQLPAGVPVAFDYQQVWEQAEKVRSSVLLALPSALNLEEHTRLVNPYQAPYIPASQVSEPGMMAPRNLVAPTRIALRNLESRRKMTVDQFVCHELRWTPEEVAEKKYLNAEQMDSVALAIDAFKRGRAFTCGDATGAGKGRQLAAIIRYLRLQGERPIFFTKTGDLFQDIYRDLEAINSLDLVRQPFIVNREETVSSANGEWTATAPLREETEKVFRSGRLPKRYDLALVTYSQVNRPAFTGDLKMTKERSEQLWAAACLAQPDVDPKRIPQEPYPDSYTLRAGWVLAAASKAGCVLFDEGHEAATPSSNIGKNGRLIASAAASVAFSSATFLKDTKNISFFKRMFPESVNVDGLVATLRSGGDAVQEALCAQLAQDGVLVRREHDLSTARIETTILSAHQDRNMLAADKLAEVLASLAYLSGEVGKIVADLEKDSEAMILKARIKVLTSRSSGGGKQMCSVNASHFNFNSRIFAISRQFMLCLKAEGVAELAVQALKEGRKPVVTFDMTLEAPLRRVIKSFVSNAVDANSAEIDALEAEEAEADDMLSLSIAQQADALEATDDIEAALVKVSLAESSALNWAESATGEQQIILPRQLTFRDILKATVASVFRVKIKRSFGVFDPENEVYTDVAIVEEVVDVATPELKAAYEALNVLMDDLPDLEAGPLDVIRRAIVRAGFTVEEISGRTLTVDTELATNGKALSVVRPLVKGTKKEVKAAFNSGTADAVLLSKAGGVGISLHASATFIDQRQRELIELQAPSDVAERLQMFGRVHRLDQVVPPIFRQVSSGLPGENRLFMIQNLALRKLSANTTSNREHSALAEHMPDLLNVVGNEVCYRFLENNPEIAKRLMIEMQEDALENDDIPVTYFSNQLTSRLILLPCNMQEEAYAMLGDEFRAYMAELDQTGTNPIRPKEFDLRAKASASEIFQEYLDVDDDSSVFNDPLLLTKLEYKEAIKGHDVPSLLRSIDYSKARLKETAAVYGNLIEMGGSVQDYDAGKVTAQDACLYGINKGRRQVLDTTLGDFASVEDALAADSENLTKEVTRRIDRLVEILSVVDFGRQITFTSSLESEKPLTGYITDFDVPSSDRLHYSNLYRVGITVPGRPVTYYRTFTQLRGDPAFNVSVSTAPDDMAYDLGAVVVGEVMRRRYVLEGNLFRAAEHSAQNKVGTLAVYTDDKGERRRGVILPMEATAKSLGNIALPDARSSFEAFEMGVNELNSSPTGGAANNIRLTKVGDRVLLYYPGSATFSRMFKDAGFAEYFSEFNGNRKSRWATVHPNKIEDLLGALYAQKLGMYAAREYHKETRAAVAGGRKRWREEREAQRDELRRIKEDRLKETLAAQEPLFAETYSPVSVAPGAATSPRVIIDPDLEQDEVQHVPNSNSQRLSAVALR